MKKMIARIAALGIGLCLLSACMAEPMPVPEYPLDGDTIEQSYKGWGPDYIIEQDDSPTRTEVGAGHSSYRLLSAENGEFMVAVSSGTKDGERVLSLTFPPFSAKNPVSFEKMEESIAFATRLFGGFTSERQVYDKFIQEYDTVNTKQKQYEISPRNTAAPYINEEIARWKSEVGGATCEIKLEQPRLDDPQEYIRSILFVTDWDTFFW